MADVLNTSIRTDLGKKDSRRLRKTGAVPAELYGHGQENVHLSVVAKELRHALKHGAHMLELQGAISETALVREVQWDALGLNIVHVDLFRVSKEEKVEVSVAIELRGVAVGVKSGGVVKQVTYELTIDCPAGAIPDRLIVKIADLELDHSITAANVELPPGATLVSDEAQVIVSCSMPMVDVEKTDELGAAGVEPELIRKEKADADEDK